MFQFHEGTIRTHRDRDSNIIKHNRFSDAKIGKIPKKNVDMQ